MSTWLGYIPFYDDRPRRCEIQFIKETLRLFKRYNVLGPIVVKRISVISTMPSELGSPTRTTGRGQSTSWKKEPVPAIADQASPTIIVPAGMVNVDVTTYVPASKKMIAQPAYYMSIRILEKSL